MTDKSLISEYTYRSLASQKANAGEMPIFILPDDLPQLFRPTTRKVEDRYHVDSLAIIAKKEEDFREFLDQAKKRKAQIISREDNKTFTVNGNCENIVKWWKDARRNSVTKIGARMSADKKKSISAEGVAKIKDKWPLPSSEYSTKELLAIAGISLNTAKAHLGKRPIAQYNYQARMKRKANKK